MNKNLIYVIITVFIWGTNAPLVKSLLSNIPSFQALSISSFLAAACLLVINLFNGSMKRMKQYRAKHYLHMAGLGFIGMFLYNGLYYIAMKQMTAQEACILNYLWPIMLVLFSCLLLKEKMTVRKAIAMLMSFAGIIVLTAGGGGTAQGNRMLGAVLCILAAASYGLFCVLNKMHDMDQNISMMVIWFSSGVFALVAGLCSEQWIAVTPVQWIGLTYLGAVIDGLAYLLWAIALKGWKSSALAANLSYLVPFLSIILSAIFLKEEVKLTAVAALVLIIGGILIQSLRIGKNKLADDAE